jgi:hypothetical protein
MPRKLLITLVVGLLAMGLSAATAAANGSKANGRHHVVLEAPKQVFVNYDHCAAADGTPLKCITTLFKLTNYSRATVNCDVYLWDLNLLVAHYSDTLARLGGVAGHGFTVPYTGDRLILAMSCNGLDMPGQTRYIQEVDA